MEKSDGCAEQKLLLCNRDNKTEISWHDGQVSHLHLTVLETVALLVEPPSFHVNARHLT